MLRRQSAPNTMQASASRCDIHHSPIEAENACRENIANALRQVLHHARRAFACTMTPSPHMRSEANDANRIVPLSTIASSFLEPFRLAARFIASAAGFKQEPGAPLRLIDPDFDEAGASHIPAFIADSVGLAHGGG
jgi:hypothetical protein